MSNVSYETITDNNNNNNGCLGLVSEVGII